MAGLETFWESAQLFLHVVKESVVISDPGGVSHGSTRGVEFGGVVLRGDDSVNPKGSSGIVEKE